MRFGLSERRREARLRFSILCLAFAAGCAQAAAQTILIEGASVLDGLGSAARNVSVRVSGDKIIEVGDLKANAGERVVAARGLVLAPGFIDVHNHSDRGLTGDPAAVSQISQGITTLVVGV